MGPPRLDPVAKDAGSISRTAGTSAAELRSLIRVADEGPAPRSQTLPLR
jgi:hypothetical protein